MKKQCFPVLISLILLAMACSKNDTRLPEVAERETVSLWAETEKQLILPSYAGNDAVLVSKDAAIATAAWLGDRVLVTAHATGNTTITLRSAEAGKPLLYIAVFSRSVETAYGWRRIENDQWKTAVTVKARRAAEARTLRQQLLDSLKSEATGNGFIFRSNEVAEYSRNRQLYKVGYTFNNWKLTLNHEGWQEEIPLQPVQYNVIGLTQDLTRQYKARYPGKHIAQVTVTRYFNEVLPPG
ncbi:hypothetical protein LL912_06565 [Niabella sp. CC-SYL272]|uniref:hypothetical protein n=1 Tax=Niabella agricola TaxID=2891571 RepID=UPI001F1B5D4B|nr:hypothetical protein [Niabella agricola]MCF3108433.1 hypothetical protein [Niabella agricola]